jgi:GrpB-like predicted nucleotidyltransferase (UPF0157 family)
VGEGARCVAAVVGRVHPADDLYVGLGHRGCEYPDIAAEPVRIVPYDPAWPARFEAERAALAELLDDVVTGGIHHVGSTAVPGLAAKPIIDIQLGVADLETARSCIEPLAALDYLYAPYRADEIAWFCKPSPERRTHHLHVVPVGSPRFRAVLEFRDLLRSDERVAREYEAMKRRLAGELGHDREAYTEAKQPFIESALGAIRRAH